MSRSRARALVAVAVVVLVAMVVPASPVAAEPLKRIDSISLAPGENELLSAVIDPAGRFAYFGTDGSPARVVKVDLRTFSRVGAITMGPGEDLLRSALIDPGGRFAYFGSFTSGRVVKIDLRTFSRVGAITLDTGEDIRLRAAVMDPGGEYAYFAPGRHVVKVDLATFAQAGILALDRGITSAAIDPAGAFAYFGTQGDVVKVDLAAFAPVDSVALDEDHGSPSALIDPAGRFLYIGSTLGHVDKIDLAGFERSATIRVGGSAGSEGLHAAVMDPRGRSAFFVAAATPSHVLEVDLARFREADAIALDRGDVPLRAAVIDPDGEFAYYGAGRRPGKVVRVRVGAGDPPPPSRFIDVPRSAYYTFPVDWAAQTGVTTGVGGSNRFEPLRSVTRAEAITFLWRARGSPPVSSSHGFVDVPVGSYYDAAVRWAKASGVTTGVGGSNRFEPLRSVTRAEVVTFLWRAVDRVGGAASHGFVDVPAGSYYDAAVRWAKASGVTTGVGGSNRFVPLQAVDRAQAVTFLNRHYG